MAKNNLGKNLGIMFIIGLLIFAIYSYTGFIPESTKQNVQETINKVTGGGGSSPAVVNNGASIKAYIVDENGNIKEDLNPEKMPQAFAILSYANPTGYTSISSPTCVSNCSFLAISTQLDNSKGDSNLKISSVIASTKCSSGNNNSACSTIPNVFGSTTISGTKRGNLNSKYSPLLPLTLNQGQLSSAIISDAMSLDEVSLGLIDFRIDINGTYRDPFGNDMPLSNKYGTLTLRAVKSTCSDNTPVDPTSGDADISTYCSVVNKGKYCRVGSQGIPTLTDKASFCGCPNGQYAVGEICKSNSCTSNSCISGTVNYCIDGVNVETRCQQCGLINCPKDANGASAISCNPATSGTSSQCVYSGGSGNGLLVSVSNVNIPTVASCGDGIKSGTEQCDKSDFGGQSCTSIGAYSGGILKCTTGCAYDTTSCVSGFVKFRSIFNNISAESNVDSIAFNTGLTTCNNQSLKKLTEYTAGNGEIPGNICDVSLANLGYSKLFTLPSGKISIQKGTSTVTTSLALYFKASTGDYAFAGYGLNKCIWVGFRESTQSAVSDSYLSVDSSKEINC